MPGRWRILVSDKLADSGLARLKEQAEVVDSAEALGTVDGWIVRSRTRVEAESLRRAVPRLKVVGRAGVGTDNIDLEAAVQAGVMVVNAPQAATHAVAELTLGLMLSLARHIPTADAAIHHGEWPKGSLAGGELRGKTLGLIGLGRIGREVGRLAAAFGMRVLAHDPYLTEATIRAAGAEPAGLPSLLESSDYVSLHLPLTEETRGLLSDDAFSRLKPGARLVCAARGGVIDEDALLRALDQGRLAGAALDVFAHEPPEPGPLTRHPRVVTTPHIGAQTAEAQDRVSVEIVEQVLTGLSGGSPTWRVV